jgi:hypothetical protein
MTSGSGKFRKGWKGRVIANDACSGHPSPITCIKVKVQVDQLIQVKRKLGDDKLDFIITIGHGNGSARMA